MGNKYIDSVFRMCLKPSDTKLLNLHVAFWKEGNSKMVY